MLSVIALKEELSNIFNKETGLVEVYATMDFSLEQEAPVLTVLCNDSLDVAQLYYKILAILPKMRSFYATQNHMDSILKDNKLIWRKGVWYV